MECEYAKYGCNVKCTNNDHQQLHMQGLAHHHLRLVVNALEKEIEKTKALEKEVEKSKTLGSTVDALLARLEQAEKKIKNHDQLEYKIQELESKLILQGLTAERNGRPNGTCTPIPEQPEPKTKDEASPEVKAKDETPVKTPNSHEKRASWHPQSTPRSDYLARQELSRPSSANSLRPDEKKKEEKKEERKEEKEEKNAKSDEEVRSVLGSMAKGDVAGIKKEDLRPMLASPPPYIVKGANLDINRSRAKTWSNTPSRQKKEIDSQITFIPSDVPLETGVIWEYDSVSDEWCRGVVKFRMTKSHFAEGALRTAHMLEIHGDPVPASDLPIDKLAAGKKIIRKDLLPCIGLQGDKYVAKISKTKVPIERYFEDVKMQMVCVELAKQFNLQGTPKKVEFLTAWVLEVPKATGSLWYGLEHYIGGEFKKQSNNHGGVLEPRNTPQAFSHFTWEHSKHTLIVVDLQGVDDDYTDPQIHTKDGLGYGVGNLGKTGIDRFLKTHQCNAVCQYLNLPRINALDTKSAMQKLIKGTQQVPFIDDQLAHGVVLPHLDIPDDVSSGEFQCVQSLTGHADRVVSLCVTPKYLFSGSSDGALRVWSLPSLNFDRELNVHRKSVEAICANEKYLFTASADHSIKVWDASSFALTIALRDHVGEVNAIILTDKSLNYLVSASFDKNIKVWSLRTFKCVQTLSGHSKCVRTLAISGSILFSGSNDGSIYMWSLKNMACLFALDAHEGWVKSLVIKDKTLYSGSFDFHIKEWNVTSFQNGELLLDHNDNVNSLCITDRFLISGSDDKTAMVWDLTSRKVVAILKGHRLGVQAVATDGKQIFTASDDCSIKVWKWFGGNN